MDFVRGKARGRADEVVISIFDMGSVDVQSFRCSLQTLDVLAVVWIADFVK